MSYFISTVSYLVVLYLLQTQEVRLRLNVEVAVPSESTPVPPPIESFTDMVTLRILAMMNSLTVKISGCLR